MLHQITHRVGVPGGAKELVRMVFHDITKARSKRFKYDAHSGVRLLGRKPVIRARVVYTAMQTGVDITEATLW